MRTKFSESEYAQNKNARGIRMRLNKYSVNIFFGRLLNADELEDVQEKIEENTERYEISENFCSEKIGVR